MKTLLSILFGVIVGYIGSYHYYHTTGKIHITETKTITNIVSVTETQIVEQLAYQYITKTNEVWKTNIVENIVQVKPVESITPVTPVVRKVVEQPKIVQPVTAPASAKPSSFKGARSTVIRDAHGKIIPVKRNMDGSIKE